MSDDDIIRLAREAEVPMEYSFNNGATIWGLHPSLERFANLVAAAERERMKAEGWRQCATGQKTTQFCGLLEEAVKAEREALAKMFDGPKFYYAEQCAAAIRARGANDTRRPANVDKIKKHFGVKE